MVKLAKNTNKTTCPVVYPVNYTDTAKGMVDVSIECAHIYRGDPVSAEHRISAALAAEIIDREILRGSEVSAVSLIDDYHGQGDFDETCFVGALKEHGVELTHLAYEASFEAPALTLVDWLGRRLRRESFNQGRRSSLMFRKADGSRFAVLDGLETGAPRPTCALLSAAWMLSRLGYLRPPEGALRPLENAPWVAERIVTVLPEKYRRVEDNVRSLVAAIDPVLLWRVRSVYFADYDYSEGLMASTRTQPDTGLPPT